MANKTREERLKNYFYNLEVLSKYPNTRSRVYNSLFNEYKNMLFNTKQEMFFLKFLNNYVRFLMSDKIKQINRLENSHNTRQQKHVDELVKIILLLARKIKNGDYKGYCRKNIIYDIEHIAKCKEKKATTIYYELLRYLPEIYQKWTVNDDMINNIPQCIIKALKQKGSFIQTCTTKSLNLKK